jgi:hypothetical protein
VDGAAQTEAGDGSPWARSAAWRRRGGRSLSPHRVISLLKRWLMGTNQGAVAPEYLQDYLDEFTFRFNRRSSALRGKLFDRLAQQAVQIAPTTYDSPGHHNPQR